MRELWEPFIEAGKRILVESASASIILGNPASDGEDEMLTRPKSGIETAESLLRKIPPDRGGAKHWLRSSNQEPRAHLIQAEDEEGFKDLEIGFGKFAITVDSINAQASVYIRQGRWKKSSTVPSPYVGRHAQGLARDLQKARRLARGDDGRAPDTANLPVNPRPR